MFVIVGDYDAGIALLSDYLNRHAVNDANEDGALYWLGRSFAAKKEYYRALGIYRELLNRFPSSVYAYQTRQFVQDIEKSLQASTSEKDIQKIAVRQNRYLTLVAELLELQNKLLDLKKQKIDELTLMMSREGL
jgi:tetratricopeptide (TPR) repeat protein